VTLSALLDKSLLSLVQVAREIRTSGLHIEIAVQVVDRIQLNRCRHAAAHIWMDRFDRAVRETHALDQHYAGSRDPPMYSD
jgi:hypothetical protein